MAEVVSLDDVRARRRGFVPAPASPATPSGGLSLAWRVLGAGEGHRRVRGRGAACGAVGTLVLAEPGTPPCGSCWGPS